MIFRDHILEEQEVVYMPRPNLDLRIVKNQTSLDMEKNTS